MHADAVQKGSNEPADVAEATGGEDFGELDILGGNGPLFDARTQEPW